MQHFAAIQALQGTACHLSDRCHYRTAQPADGQEETAYCFRGIDMEASRIHPGSAAIWMVVLYICFIFLFPLYYCVSSFLRENPKSVMFSSEGATTTRGAGGESWPARRAARRCPRPTRRHCLPPRAAPRRRRSRASWAARRPRPCSPLRPSPPRDVPSRRRGCGQ